MTLFVINILLALVWVALTQSFTAGNCLGEPWASWPCSP